MADRIVDSGAQDADKWDNYTFRPKRFEDFLGQDKVKEQLKIAIEAARSRGEVLEHVLLSGPQGLGKSTLSNLIAHEMDVGIRTTVGPMMVQKADLAAILTNLQQGDVLFIEATGMPGSKGFQMTGSLGDVMQESARAALSFVRSRAEITRTVGGRA